MINEHIKSIMNRDPEAESALNIILIYPEVVIIN